MSLSPDMAEDLRRQDDQEREEWSLRTDDNEPQPAGQSKELYAAWLRLYDGDDSCPLYRRVIAEAQAGNQAARAALGDAERHVARRRALRMRNPLCSIVPGSPSCLSSKDDADDSLCRECRWNAAVYLAEQAASEEAMR